MQPYTLHINDSAYPTRLRACKNAPETLYAIGNTDANRGHFVAIVGTRHASERCKDLTVQLVRELASQIPDLVVVSGLAYGIDVTAHRTAIECGVPTIIVPGHGLDRIYPQVHRPVAVAALNAGGAIFTEYPEGTEIYGSNFLDRNRIIAGLSDCTVVVESKARGGSLCTARHARAFGRPVFAFPGRPGDQNCEGCNILIRDIQARLINGAQDLISLMGWQPSDPTLFDSVPDTLHPSVPDSPLGTSILDELRKHEDGMHINELTERLGIPYAELAAELVLLELDDLVRSLPGAIYRAVG